MKRLRTQMELDGAWAETHPLFCVEAMGNRRQKKDMARRPQMIFKRKRHGSGAMVLLRI